MRIAICVPSFDDVKADFCFSLSQMTAYVGRYRRDIAMMQHNEKNSVIEVARHRCVLVALAYKADYILWIDSDMVFPQETLNRLVDMNKDIIGCQAIMRSPPHASNTYDIEGNAIIYPDKIVECRYIGTGVLMVKMDVYKKIGPPYYKVNYIEGGYWQGEDLNFCDRATEAGYKLYCHGPLSKQIYHIGSKRYGYEDKQIGGEATKKEPLDGQNAGNLPDLQTP